jgi:hypothetical protein
MIVVKAVFLIKLTTLVRAFGAFNWSATFIFKIGRQKVPSLQVARMAINTIREQRVCVWEMKGAVNGVYQFIIFYAPFFLLIPPLMIIIIFTLFIYKAHT